MDKVSCIPFSFVQRLNSGAHLKDVLISLERTARSHSEKLLPKDRIWSEKLIIAPWPTVGEPFGWEEESIKDFELLQEIVRAIRNTRAEKNVKPGQTIPATIVAGEYAPTLENEAAALANLSRLDPEQLSIHASLETKPENCVVLVIGQIEIFLP